MRTIALLLVAAAATGALVQHAGAHATAAFCKGAALTGHFTAVKNSEGAGNIVYRLQLANRSTAACSLTGIPIVSLRGKLGQKLPTHVRAANPGQTMAVLVTLEPGQSARATARFSPDVQGPGEDHPGACEPKAYHLVVSAKGGGTTSVPITPPTSICEHGQLSFSVYTRP